MALRRTYRILPLLIGLLVGAAAPAVVACTMTPDNAAAANVHHHEYKAGDRVPDAHHNGVEAPCREGSAEQVHLCCLTDGQASSSATILADAASRTLGPTFACVLPDRALQACLLHSLHSLRARPPAFTPATLRQALLATFLI